MPRVVQVRRRASGPMGCFISRPGWNEGKNTLTPTCDSRACVVIRLTVPCVFFFFRGQSLEDHVAWQGVCRGPSFFCVTNQGQVRATCCSEHPQDLELTMPSGLLRTLVWERLLLPLEVWKTSASGSSSWTRTDGIGRHAPGLEGCERERQALRERWLGSVARLG